MSLQTDVRHLISIASASLAIALAAGAAGAAPPSAPVHDVDYTADFAFVGDPLLGMEVGEQGQILKFAADGQSHEASVTKSWTLKIAQDAINDGTVSENDAVTISTWAARGHMSNHVSVALPTPLAAGMQFRLIDLMHLSYMTSDGTATLAVAEHVAREMHPELKVAPLVNDPEAPEQYFVDDMNQAAIDMGLTSTVFETSYGAGHGHTAPASGNDDGTDSNHLTTAREIARWFDEAMKDDAYRELMSFRGTYNFNRVDAPFTNYSINFNPGYPGLVGRKPGGNENCSTCLVSMANRIGRDIVAGFMQSNSGSTVDESTLLDYGFAKTFYPLERGLGERVGEFKSHSLSCFDDRTAASAVVTSEGNLRVVRWGVNVDTGKHVEVGYGSDPCADPDRGGSTTGTIGTAGDINSPGRVEVPTKILDYYSWAPEDDGRGDPSDGENPGPDCNEDPSGGYAYALAREAHMDYAGAGNLVVATETTMGLQLSSWGVPASQNEPFQRDFLAIGGGSDIQVEVLSNDGLFATVHRDAADRAVIRTWSMDLASGQIDPGPLDTFVSNDTIAKFDLAGRHQIFLTSHLTMAVLTTTGTPEVWSFNVGSNNGVIFEGSQSIHPKDAGTSAGPIRIARVHGFDDDPMTDVYVLGYRFSGALRMRAFGVAVNGSITNYASHSGASHPIGPDGALEIASYKNRGVFVAVKEDQSDFAAELSVWAIDPTNNGNVWRPNFIVGESSEPNLGLLDMCRAPGPNAEGDFLIAQSNFFDNDDELSGWRSGERPICGLVGLEPFLVAGLIRGARRLRRGIEVGI